MADVLTVVWKETKEALRMGGGRRGGYLGMLLGIGVFGVFLPLQMGRSWVTSPSTLVFWAWVPLMLVSGVVADSFAGERERRTLETLLASRLPDRAILFGKVVAAIAYGWVQMIVMLLCGLVTVNIAHGSGGLLLYSPTFVVGGLAGGLLTAGLAATAGVLVSLRAATVRQAAQTLNISIMLCLFIPAFGLPALPERRKAALLSSLTTVGPARWIAIVGAVLVAADAVLLAAAMARFRRARLILD